MSLVTRLIHFRDGGVEAWRACVDPYQAGTWEAWFNVQPGDVIFEVDDSLDMPTFHQIADGRVLSLEEVQGLTGGHVTDVPHDATPKDGHQLLFRKRGRGKAGQLISRYIRKEDETEIELMRRRARGEVVPEIPQDEELAVVLHRKAEGMKPIAKDK